MADSTNPFSASVIPFEVPEQMRAFAEQGVSQARDHYAKFKTAAEGSNSAVEAVFGVASKGASDYSAKLLEFFQVNTNAGFDFAQDMIGVKSLSQAVDLWTSHTRKQVETLTAQSQELAQLTQKIAASTVEPIKDGASKVITPAA